MGASTRLEAIGLGGFSSLFKISKPFLEGQGSHEYAKESLQLSGPDRWEGVGGGKPCPLGLVTGGAGLWFFP